MTAGASRRATARRALVAAWALLALASLGAAACSSDGGSDADEGGASSARAAVDAHVAASGRFDLAAACDLLAPAKRREMAAIDGGGVEGYCERATAEVVDSATPETKARAREIYADAEVAELDRAGGPWYSIVSADGSFHEDVRLVQVEGRWWVAELESDVDDEDHDH